MASFLIVDDDRTAANTLCALVRRRGHEALPAYDGAQALGVLESRPVDVVVTDLRMPNLDGMRLLQTARARWPDVVVIVVTAFGSVEAAVEAMKLGAFDFVTKPLDVDELHVKLEKAVTQRQMALKIERMSARIESLEAEERYRGGMGEIVGASAAMQGVFETIDKVAPTDSSVLLLGETGTGKGLVARAIHQRSTRSGGPLVQMHCAAYAEGVVESEMFGHERGAFTGAVARKIGRFEMADGGTLFLDEVGDIPPGAQTKLLRVVQEREFERVGGTKTIRVDFRLVCATNRDLEAAIGKGTFREDLFYRLNVFTIRLPPLRERKEDIPRLVEVFLRRESRRLGHALRMLEARALEALMAYDWPGNVRELHNVIERAAVLAGTRAIDPSHLPPMMAGPRTAYVTPPEDEVDFVREMEDFERRLIRHAYERSGHVKAKAAKMLGIDRNRFRYKLKKLGIED